MSAPGDDVPTELLDRLYGLPLDAFVAERDTAARGARADGDRTLATRIGALPKPTLAAWAVDQAVRRLPQAVEAVIALGDELRAATGGHDRARLGALDRERRRLLDALTAGIADTVRPGDRALSEATLRAVRDTLVAAVADPGAAAAVRAGHLARGLQHVGFGVVDEAGEPVELARPAPSGGARREPTEPAGGAGVDRTPGLAAPEPSDDPRRDVAAANDALDLAEEALDAARDVLRDRTDAEAAAARALAAADEALTAAEDELARLEERLAALRTGRDVRASATDDARTAREAAEREVARLDGERAAAEESAASARRRRREQRRRR